MLTGKRPNLMDDRFGRHEIGIVSLDILDKLSDPFRANPISNTPAIARASQRNGMSGMYSMIHCGDSGSNSFFQIEAILHTPAAQFAGDRAVAPAGGAIG